MKRIFVLVLMLGVIAALGITTVVNAQNGNPPSTPPAPGEGWGPGQMMGRGGMQGRMGGMMSAQANHGQMQPYMHKELAAKLGVSETELQALHDGGQTFWQIAEAKGFSTEEAQQMMLDARATALDAMVADGVITQEQADFMKTRMGGKMGGGRGAGGCMGNRTGRGW